ncbi:MULTISPECIES: DUF397 domain-containing protein [Streptomycetaceae]|uniref:DUF397 domain-containing protein n=1 Tax=Streptomycetaceae TaxID=2062 RepID=UPI0012FF8A9F|nr:MULTISPECIES: DUF397 domain-containing protein [Streptomycetaceae]MYS60676.1 DUF397 domain-containing protein [Streptomyces sp. SID5468]
MEAGWTRSSHSLNEDSYCVEVAIGERTVRVRDSKDPTGPRLTFGHAAWAAFLDFLVTRPRSRTPGACAGPVGEGRPGRR